MTTLRQKFEKSPVTARVAPFLVFVLLTSVQGITAGSWPYWIYLAKTLVGVWSVWLMRPFVTEIRWEFSLLPVATGVGVFALWVGLDGWYPKLIAVSSGWNPTLEFGKNSAAAGFFIAVRLTGASLLVPVLEEVFYRSFLNRCLTTENWQSLPVAHFAFKSVVIGALIFGFSHREWLAGIFCAVAYQALVWRRGHLGAAIVAHGITNLLLGLWVVRKGAWQFW